MSKTSPSKAMIDLRAYAHNLKVVKDMIPNACRVMVVVKADGYGHGAVPIAKRALVEGMDMLGVATVDEGIALRQAGIDAPILVLVQPSEGALGAALEFGLRLMVSDARIAERLGDLARRLNKVVPIHCKVDSGMGRQGFDIERILGDMPFLTRISHIDVEGIATHFPVAESARDPFTQNQIKAFKHLLKQLDREGIPYEMAHAANSAAIVNYPGSAFDLVRPGLMTYGVWPGDMPPENSILQPVMRWETQIVLTKELDTGSTVGYGRTFTASKPMRVAVLPVGYADGYKYTLSNNADVLVRGKRCPVRGSISMDQTVIDVTDVPKAAIGDTVTLVGADGDERITVEELAAKAQTIPYDFLTGIGSRVERAYTE